jgi:hypothetical protein
MWGVHVTIYVDRHGSLQGAKLHCAMSTATIEILAGKQQKQLRLSWMLIANAALSPHDLRVFDGLTNHTIAAESFSPPKSLRECAI